MNNIYYYTDINYIPPGIVSRCGIFSCTEDDANLANLREGGRFDVVKIGVSDVPGDWTNPHPGYSRNIDPKSVTNTITVNGVTGVVGEDELVLASRMWISHSTNHKRMSNDMMHKLAAMHIYMSSKHPDQILLGPSFNWDFPTPRERFLVQMEITSKEWERLYLGMINTENTEYNIVISELNYRSPRTILLYVTSGEDDYFNKITEVIRDYKQAGHDVEQITTEEWCPFPLPGYDTPAFRKFMAKWMLENQNLTLLPEYRDDLKHYAGGVVHERDHNSGPV